MAGAPTSPGKRPTQREVALRAGVSQGVVSQVLNGKSGVIRVNDATRERVLRAMADLGYTPNVAARSLAGGRSHILGVFTSEPVFPLDTRDFYHPFLEGIEAQAAALRYDLLLHTRSAGSAATQRLPLADGTLVLGELRDPQTRRELARLVRAGLAAVFVGRRELADAPSSWVPASRVPASRVPVSWVAADYAGGTREAVRALLALGHRRIRYVGTGGPGDVNESAQDRERGYREGVAQARLDPVVQRTGEIDVDDARRWALEGTSGLLFENDVLARAWLAAARSAGLSVPADASFAVLGDARGSGEPGRWASLRLPRRAMGETAVTLLDGLLRGGEPAQVTLPCTWVTGESLAPVPVKPVSVRQG